MVQTHHPEHIKRLYSVLNKLKQFSETITSTEEREDQLADKYPDKYDSSDEAHLNRLKICSEAVKEMNEKMEVALELIKRLEARTLITKDESDWWLTKFKFEVDRGNKGYARKGV